MASAVQLSAGQRAAVQHEDGPAAVYAGPGSGKTRVVALRAARLAGQGRRLLVTTFTNDATEEMKARIAPMIPKEGPGAAHITTMHALCLHILRAQGEKFQLLTDEFLRRNLAETAQAAELEGGIGGFLTRVSYQKNVGVTAAAYKHDGSSEDRDFARTWRAYEKAKLEKGLRDFDDLILDALALLEKDEALRRRVAAQYTHIIVDECQDMNAPQYAIAFALGRDHKNLMLVGDLDQSLYGFRGADTQTFRHFAAHPQTQVYELRENYRCTRSILTFADSLIRQDAERRALTFVPTRPEGEPVTWHRYPDPDLEALAVGEQILRLVRRGAKYREIAVLYRANAQSEAFERHFAALGIPYSLREDGDFYARKEVQGLLAYLNFFTADRSTSGGTDLTPSPGGPNPPSPFPCRDGRDPTWDGCGPHPLSPFPTLRERESGKAGSPPSLAGKGAGGLGNGYEDEWLLALLNVPNRKLSRMVGAQLRNWAEIRGKRIWDILPEFHAADLKTHRTLRQLRQELQRIAEKLPSITNAGEAIRIIRAVTDFDGWLRRSEQDDRDNDRIQNVQRMQAAAAHYPTIAEYLAAVQRVREEAARRKAERAKKRREQDEVTLGTGHSAKGLEWRYVFAVGWSEELLPHRKAEDIAEERRIAYVIATRARDLLVISSPDTWNDAAVAPSRFLTGLQLAATSLPSEAPLDTEPEPEPDEALGGLFMV
ncbi:MAG TPA: ATP-dependent helicase [Chthonomonadaceae bacterium]|nr:ATP-dependent helicase [Chthonomonadaceae bacterium]